MGSYLSDLYNFIIPEQSSREHDEEWVRLRLHRLRLYNAEILEAHRTETPPPEIIPGEHTSQPVNIR